MVKVKASVVKRELKEQEEMYGDSDDFESKVDDVEERYERVVGHKPVKGETLAQEIDHAEKSRFGKDPHSEKRKEEGTFS